MQEDVHAICMSVRRKKKNGADVLGWSRKTESNLHSLPFQYHDLHRFAV